MKNRDLGTEKHRGRAGMVIPVLLLILCLTVPCGQLRAEENADTEDTVSETSGENEDPENGGSTEEAVAQAAQAAMDTAAERAQQIAGPEWKTELRAALDELQDMGLTPDAVLSRIQKAVFGKEYLSLRSDSEQDPDGTDLTAEEGETPEDAQSGTTALDEAVEQARQKTQDAVDESLDEAKEKVAESAAESADTLRSGVTDAFTGFFRSLFGRLLGSED